MPPSTFSGVTIHQQNGSIFFLGPDSKPMLAFTPEACEMLIYQLADAIREARGQEKASFSVLAEVLAQVLGTPKGADVKL